MEQTCVLWFVCGIVSRTFVLFSEPTTEILGGPELFIDQGSTINLTCLVQFAPEPPPTVGWRHEKQVSGTIYVLFSTTLTKKNGPFRIWFSKWYVLLHVFFFFSCVCVRFTAHKFRFSTRRNKPGNGKRVDHQQQIINSKGVVFRYRLLLLRSVKCKFGHRQGSYIKRLVALNYTWKCIDGGLFCSHYAPLLYILSGS